MLHKNKTAKTSVFAACKAAVMGTAAVIVLAGFFTSCKQNAGGGGAKKVRVTLERTLGGNVEVSPALPADGKVKKGSSITFTAKPLAGFNLEKWELNGQAVNGTELTYTLKAVKESKVKVYFKSGGSGVTSFKVTLNAGANGKLSSDPPIPSDGMIPENTELTFKAEPDSGYEADKWQITGGAFEAGTGTAGSTTAKVKLTADITVSLSFKKSGGGGDPAYVKVPYTELDAYLRDTASSTEINYIEVTGTIQPEDFKGSGGSTLPSVLGQKIKTHPAKKIALKLPATVPGLTDMSRCFYKCENLVSVENIPEGVTSMGSCFFGCTGLAQAPVIPQSVNNITHCFYWCTALKKAPALPKNIKVIDSCFDNCTSLTEAPHIPKNVESVAECFSNCTSLTQAPDIPAGVKDMWRCFDGCISLKRVKLHCNYNPAIINAEKAFLGLFNGCTSLEAGGIKVRAAFYNNYTDAAALNVMAVPPAGNTAEQKKKFSKF